MKIHFRLLLPFPRLVLFLIVLLSVATTAPAADPAFDQNWPQWRGPLATGVAPSANPPLTWSETSNVKWKVKIPGSGSASPIVWDNYVFVQTAIPTGKKGDAPATPKPAPAPATPPPGQRAGGFVYNIQTPDESYQFALVCLDRQTGNILWQRVVREEVPHEGYFVGEGSLASQSPMTDGRCVYAFFGSRGLACYDFSGNLKWRKDLGRLKIKMEFGEGSSAALYGNTLVVNWDNEGASFITALDKETGDELWKKPRQEGTSWTTPLMIPFGGRVQVVTDAAQKIRSYDLANGDLLWECSGLTSNIIPTPVTDGKLVFCMSGYQGYALLAIRLDRSGDLTGTDAIAWRTNRNTPYVPSPLLYGGRLYCSTGNNGMFSCFDPETGNALFKAARLEAIPQIYASPVGASGRIYLPGRNGVTLVFKRGDQLEILATNRLNEKFDASPAAVGRELFLRGREYLYCLAEK